MIDDRTEGEYLGNVNKYQERLKNYICPTWSRISGQDWVVISENLRHDLVNIKDKGDLECEGELIEVKEAPHYPIIVLKSYQLIHARNEHIDYLLINEKRYCRISAEEILEKGAFLPTSLRLYKGKGDFGIKFKSLDWEDFI